MNFFVCTVSENMEDPHHQVVLVESPNLPLAQILIFVAWTAFVNKPSCANHVLSKPIVTTLYIELRYIFLQLLTFKCSLFCHSFILSSNGMGLTLKRRLFVMLASPSSSTTPVNLALFLSKVQLTLLYLIRRGFTELTSISVAVASPL